jgi:thioredoxin-dependent peroxiredoxin
MLAIGSKAPVFSLENQDSVLLSNSEVTTPFLLIYFYPKDDTPGCTKEA